MKDFEVISHLGLSRIFPNEMQPMPHFEGEVFVKVINVSYLSQQHNNRE